MRRVTSLTMLCFLAAIAGSASARRNGLERGLWIGPIHVCRDTAQVTTGTDQRDNPMAIITFRPAWRGLLERETGRRVGRRMPVRLDRRLISQPMVMEPLTVGMLELAAASRAEAEAIRSASRRPC